MSRDFILNKIIEHFEKELDLYQKISDKARSDATSSELKQEGKYDTRAIEASYLAGAQERRKDEITLELQGLKVLQKKLSSNESSPVAKLMTLESESQLKKIFLVPCSGGFEVKYQGESVQVLSTRSPLGSKILKLEEGQSSFELLLHGTLKEYRLSYD